LATAAGADDTGDDGTVAGGAGDAVADGLDVGCAGDCVTVGVGIDGLDAAAGGGDGGGGGGVAAGAGVTDIPASSPKTWLSPPPRGSFRVTKRERLRSPRSIATDIDSISPGTAMIQTLVSSAAREARRNAVLTDETFTGTANLLVKRNTDRPCCFFN